MFGSYLCFFSPDVSTLGVFFSSGEISKINLNYEKAIYITYPDYLLWREAKAISNDPTIYPSTQTLL